MKKLLIVISALTIVLTACKRNDHEFLTYSILVDNYYFTPNQLHIETTFIGPKIDVDTVFIDVTQNSPFNHYVYGVGRVNKAGKNYFTIGGFNSGATYNFFITGTNWDGNNKRYFQSQPITTTPAP